jgi:hypothetical protein
VAIGPVPPLVGNSNTPQLLDLGRAAGFGLALWIAGTGPTAAPGALYQYGTHAQAIHNSQAGGRVIQSVPGNEGSPSCPPILTTPQFPEPRAPFVSLASLERTVSNRSLSATRGAPQSFDFTQQAQISVPVPTQTTSGLGAEYTYGTHAVAIHNSQAGGRVIPTALAPTPTLSPRALIVPPQAFDFTRQGFIPFVPVASGWVLTMASSGPQAFDFTLQPWQTDATPTPLTQGPKAPAPIYGQPQSDPTQIAAQFFKPSPKAAINVSPRAITARQEDPTQIGARVFAALPSGPGRYVQPALIVVPQQAYTDVPQPQVTAPLIGSLPIFLALNGSAFSFSAGLVSASIVQLTGIFDYFSLAQAILDFSHRTDIANYQDYYIQQAETRIYRDIFAQNIGNGVKWLEQAFSGIASGATPTPAGYLALKAMQVTDTFGNVFTLLYKDPQWIYTNYPVRQPTGIPAYVARDGANFIFGPYPDSAYVLSGTVYAASTPLSATSPTSWMTNICPDLLLASCMIELQPFLKDAAALKVWQTIYAQKLMALVNLDQSERVAPGVLTVETG